MSLSKNNTHIIRTCMIDIGTFGQNTHYHCKDGILFTITHHLTKISGYIVQKGTIAIGLFQQL